MPCTSGRNICAVTFRAQHKARHAARCAQPAPPSHALTSTARSHLDARVCLAVSERRRFDILFSEKLGRPGDTSRMSPRQYESDRRRRTKKRRRERRILSRGHKFFVAATLNFVAATRNGVPGTRARGHGDSGVLELCSKCRRDKTHLSPRPQ